MRPTALVSILLAQICFAGTPPPMYIKAANGVSFESYIKNDTMPSNLPSFMYQVSGGSSQGSGSCTTFTGTSGANCPENNASTPSISINDSSTVLSIRFYGIDDSNFTSSSVSGVTFPEVASPDFGFWNVKLNAEYGSGATSWYGDNSSNKVGIYNASITHHSMPTSANISFSFNNITLNANLGNGNTTVTCSESINFFVTKTPESSPWKAYSAGNDLKYAKIAIGIAELIAGSPGMLVGGVASFLEGLVISEKLSHTYEYYYYFNVTGGNLSVVNIPVTVGNTTYLTATPAYTTTCQADDGTDAIVYWTVDWADNGPADNLCQTKSPPSTIVVGVLGSVESSSSVESTYNAYLSSCEDVKQQGSDIVKECYSSLCDFCPATFNDYNQIKYTPLCESLPSS